MPPGTRENESYGNRHRLSRPNLINIQTKENIPVYRRMSDIGNMNALPKSDEIMLGIVLAEDRMLPKTSNSSNDNYRNIVLGIVCVDDTKLKLDELRKLICSELPSVPGNFAFFSKEGWPIQKKQEALLNCDVVINEKNIIHIKRQFEKQKVGIVISGGEPVGFIFADICTDLRQLRDLIEQQLKMSQHLKAEYRFIEKNGWPVMQTQESMLSLIDVMLGQVVCIQSCEKTVDLNCHPTYPHSVAVANSGQSTDGKTHGNSESNENSTNHRKISFKFGRLSHIRSDRTQGKSTKPGKSELDLAKPILISYVRAEAAQYALDLKKDLVNRGFSVYLDVHEIKIASDWQDSLNFAVTNCFLFVPLITPMYGKTQWTNREVKLADVLGKLIVPVNFMDHWPPACLAIQFASTQYIPWKVPDTDNVKNELEKVSDPRIWPKSQLERVALQIDECYRENCGNILRRAPSGSTSKESIRLKLNAPVYAKNDATPLYSPTLSFDELLDEKKHSIVISAHPKQRCLAKELKRIFESENYDVWCSTSWQESLDNLSSPCTPRDLPTIEEGEVFFSDKEELANSSGEIKKIPLSQKESETDGLGRRPLSRMMSQFSDISKPSTLSQEKLDRLQVFQQKVDQAGVVVVLVSREYTESTFSHQQVFYCEHRKRVVMVNCDNSQVPKWFRLLMGNDMIHRTNNPQFDCVLKARVKRALNPSSSETPRDATFEAKINYLVNFLKRNIQLQDVRVYVTGSSKLQTQRAEDICRAVGQQLAKVANISLVTNGFFGAPDITAKAFYEYREYSQQSSAEYPAVMHILPINESEDLSSKSCQNPDGSFEPMPYGKTFFIGDSLKERETAVARLVDMCVVIEGGPGVVHEVEEFIWNDHFVIPIRSTGGAAGGKYGIPMKIFELPPGVDKRDWDVLSNPDASPEEIAEAVVSIIFSLKKAVSPTNTLKAPNFRPKKLKKSKKVKSISQEEQDVPDGSFYNNGMAVQPFSIDETMQRRKFSEQVNSSEISPLTFQKKNKWSHFFRGFRRDSP